MGLIEAVKSVFYKPQKMSRDKAVFVKNLSNKYGEKNFLNNINFIVYKGEIFSVIGLSGSGKSTLLKTIVGLNRKSNGIVHFFGRNLFFSRGIIGYSPQEDSFYDDLTIIENIGLFSELYGVSRDKGLRTGSDYLKKLKIDSFKDNYPRDLSGGQRKRLNIILSSLHHPKLLILDEPFAGLDYYNRRILWDFITSLRNRGVTIVLTTHLLEEAQNYSTRVLILKNGRKFAYGTFNTIKERIRFNYLYHIKFSSLSKKFFQTLKHFSSLKKVKIIYKFRNEVQFALDSADYRDVVNNFLKGKGRDFKEISLRKPNLDEVMLASK
ncbi:hypothetical protein COS83_01400 [archaeon CG07_land_8_20_14_0_80_38_8]|nr:MAG: hypothetical protein COS83_01400 [archaeon CG07_land_8_20_14_0_80_38_8]PIU88169.1 MAG: hypothetical protein COS64_04530 [archaeon CG06_land_8_20_14_3_00_37_11]